MKSLVKLAMTLWLGVAASASMAAPQSYPLVCRGGAGTLGYNSDQGGSALMYFAKAPGPSSQGLQPGQCSWVDRAIGPNEPTCLRQANVGGASWIFPGNLTASYFNSTQAPWLRNLLKAQNYQVFQAYNPGNNCFVVTRLGP